MRSVRLTLLCFWGLYSGIRRDGPLMSLHHACTAPHIVRSNRRTVKDQCRVAARTAGPGFDPPFRAMGLVEVGHQSCLGTAAADLICGGGKGVRMFLSASTLVFSFGPHPFPPRLSFSLSASALSLLSSHPVPSRPVPCPSVALIFYLTILFYWCL